MYKYADSRGPEALPPFLHYQLPWRCPAPGREPVPGAGHLQTAGWLRINWPERLGNEQGARVVTCMISGYLCWLPTGKTM